MNNSNLQEQHDVIMSRGALPRHIAIIMDGNGRWARSHGHHRVAGHKEGVVSVREITRVCGELGIGTLTLYTFSSENWLRPRAEVDALMKLLVSTIRAEVRDLMKNNVRLTAIGELSQLPRVAQKEFAAAVEATAENEGLNLNLALSYGGRQEILEGVRKITAEVVAGRLAEKDIDQDMFSDYLYTKDIPDPDLIIRTGGEARLSNFLIWQSAYSELVITDAMWPEFRREELYKAIEVYQQRERRFGKISEQIQSKNQKV